MGHGPKISFSEFAKTHSSSSKPETTHLGNRLLLSVEGFLMSSSLKGSKGPCLLGIPFQILSVLSLSLLSLSFTHTPSVIQKRLPSDVVICIILNLVKDERPLELLNVLSPSVSHSR